MVDSQGELVPSQEAEDTRSCSPPEDSSNPTTANYVTLIQNRSTLISSGEVQDVMSFERLQLFFHEGPGSPRESVRLSASSSGALAVYRNDSLGCHLQLSAAPWQVFGTSGQFALTVKIWNREYRRQSTWIDHALHQPSTIESEMSRAARADRIGASPSPPSKRVDEPVASPVGWVMGWKEWPGAISGSGLAWVSLLSAVAWLCVVQISRQNAEESVIQSTGRDSGMANRVECAVVPVPGVDAQVLEHARSFDCTGLTHIIAHQRGKNPAIAYPLLRPFNLQDCDVKEFLTRMLVVLEYIFAEGYRIEDLEEADLFEGLDHKVVLGRFAEKLHRSSNWTQQSENLSQLARLVPPPAEPDFYLTDLIRAMTGPPADRPRPEEARDHPFFWDSRRWREKVKNWDKSLSRWEREAPDKMDQFRKDVLAFVGQDWHRSIDATFRTDMKRYLDRCPHDVRGLIKFVRNLAAHVFGSGFDRYMYGIRQAFPQLFLYMYKNVQ
jgi:hypothetical protein